MVPTGPLSIFLSVNGCGLCEKVCPSPLVNQKIMVNGLGNFIRCYISYSTDENIRWKVSSSGLVTTILPSLLKEDRISGAVIVKDDSRDPLGP